MSYKNKKCRGIILKLIFLLIFLLPISVNSDEIVFFNPSNYKVHKMSCHWGQVCTKNCIRIPRSEAYRRGGVPCKVCGG